MMSRIRRQWDRTNVKLTVLISILTLGSLSLPVVRGLMVALFAATFETVEAHMADVKAHQELTNQQYMDLRDAISDFREEMRRQNREILRNVR